MICHLFPEPLYFFFSPDLPGLLYYSHVPAVVISLLIGLFVYLNGRQYLLNRLLFLISLSFSVWVLFSLITWTNIHSDLMLFVWTFFGILYSLIAVFSVYFVYVFLTKQDVTFWHKIAFALLLLPVIAFAPTHFNLTGFDLTLCDASGYEGLAYIAYYTLMGVVAMAWILVLLVKHYLRSDAEFRKQIILIGIGIELFLFSFLITGFLASYLADAGVFTDYSLEQYGLFGMIVFMAFIAVMIVRFRTFNVGLLAAQALVIALVIVTGSQLTFVRSITNQVLTAIALVLTGTLGVVLIRSVKREIKQREQIEKLAKELEKANERQVVLIHFITHQIKGFVTKSRNIFSMMLDGDYGALPPEMKHLAEEGLRSDTQGVNTIQEILNASNIKSGKVSYDMQPFDLKALIDEIAGNLRASAEGKGLQFNVRTGDAPLTYTGDRGQLVNAFKNLIDNSIKYTLEGSVDVILEEQSGKVHFEVKDTGVGITQEDMKNLFTEGGHGKESTKVNVESTGFGLYIVKSIIEAHKGRVWAESEGKGKGSRFIVELPTT